MTQAVCRLKIFESDGNQRTTINIFTDDVPYFMMFSDIGDVLYQIDYETNEPGERELADAEEYHDHIMEM